MANPNPNIWKFLLAAGAFLLLVAFILGWVGFGVPDWHAFQRFNGSIQEYYGLWAYCQDRPVFFTSVCNRWPTAATLIFNGSQPSFISTADGLITTGMIFLSFGLATAIFSAILPLLAYLAGVLTFLSFLFLIIGLPIFGNQSNNLSVLRRDATYNKRYGFWLFVPTIIFTFLATLLFLAAGFVYQRFGFGNLATNAYSRRPPVGGQRLLGPAALLNGMPYGMRPGLYGPGMMQNPYPGPSLLSQYIAQRVPRHYGPVGVRHTVITSFPQPSIGPALGQPVGYAAPAYYRLPAAQPAYTPVINLTGQTLVGPVTRAL